MNKKELIEQFQAQDPVVGETVKVPESLTRYVNSGKLIDAKLVKIDGDDYIVETSSTSFPKRVKREDITRLTYHVGANPFDVGLDRTRTIAYSMDSILFELDLLPDGRGPDRYDINGVPVMEVNFNPYVYVDGEKKYYQRPLCWTLEDKQRLIESIYLGIDVGKVLIRKRGWEELEALIAKGETEIAFKDVVDGKQRLTALSEFFNNKIPDLHGNYYDDLSLNAQLKFRNCQAVSYAEMPENTKDADVLKQFLRMNFAGVPQSVEHLDYVRSLLG